MVEENSEGLGLKPTLGLFDATAISVGAIVGAGIFVVTGIAATGWPSLNNFHAYCRRHLLVHSLEFR